MCRCLILHLGGISSAILDGWMDMSCCLKYKGVYLYSHVVHLSSQQKQAMYETNNIVQHGGRPSYGFLPSPV